jgi:hypothetical protein
MAIVRLSSGLGNAMFMYAFGHGLQAKIGKSVKYVWQDTHREYPLGPYNVHVDFSPFLQMPYTMFKEKTFRFDPDVYDQVDSTYFDGCWQTELWFADIADEIRQELTLLKVSDEVQRVADRLRNTNSCFIHVRRGDYLKPWNQQYHGICGFDYYQKAIEHIRNHQAGIDIYTFSDDPEWCRENLPGEVISGRFDHYEDLYLMQQCRHAIIANSTYSWFGAWLGDTQPDRIVAAPSKWFNQAPLDYSDVVPSRWTKIDN